MTSEDPRRKIVAEPMTDDRQRLRRGAVKRAKGNRIAFGNHQHPDDRAVLAMESLLVEAEAELDCTDGHLLDQVKDADAWQARAEKAEARVRELEEERDWFESRHRNAIGEEGT